MRRKFKHYVDECLCSAEYFWRYLRSYYVRAERETRHWFLIYDHKEHRAAVNAVENGYTVNPTGSPTTFRREEDYA